MDIKELMNDPNLSDDTINGILSQIPVTFITMLVSGTKEVPNYKDQTELSTFISAHVIVIIGSIDYNIGKSSFNIPEYLSVNWKDAKIVKSVLVFDSDGIRDFLLSPNVKVAVQQREDRYLIPVTLLTSSNMKYILDKREYNLNYEYGETFLSSVIIGTTQGIGVGINSGLTASTNQYEFYSGFQDKLLNRK